MPPCFDRSLLGTLMLAALSLSACMGPIPHRAAKTQPHPLATMPPVQATLPPVPLVSDREVAPGIRWKQYGGTSPRWKAPLFANVLEFDPTDKRYRVAVIQAHGRPPSCRESTRRIARKVGAIAAINGSYFHFVARRKNGDPIGLVLSEGELINPARGDRPAMGIMADGRVFFGTPVRRRDVACALQLDRLSALRAPAPAIARRPEPPVDGIGHAWRVAVAFIRRQSAVAAPDAPPVEKPGYRNTTALGYPWIEAKHALEGGPLLVHDGRAVELKGFNWSILKGREPRTAVGITREGKMLWITIDGRRPNHSMGTNLAELTQLFLSLGAVEALNWDGGGSTTMVIKGDPVTKIATGWVREVSNAVVLLPASGSASL